jgi:hypothetical protein
VSWFFGPLTTAPRPQPQIEAWVDRTGLQPIELVLNDLFGLDALPASRTEAMSIPAIARARKLLCTTIGRLPLRVYRGAEQLPDLEQPTWTYRTDGQVPFQRMVWTVDDLIFYGASLWHDPDATAGFPLRLERVPWHLWEWDGSRFIDADGHPYPAGTTVLIEGPDEGILSFGGRTIRSAAALEATVASVAAHPFRLELHQTSGDQLTDAEKTRLVGAARQALADNEGILFTNQAVETKEHGAAGSGPLLVEGRNASAVDCARLVGIPAAMIDATSAGASLTYETTTGRNQEFWDYGVSAYAAPIAARLSMDDVVPRGQRTSFDTSEVTALSLPTGGTPTQD